MRKSQQRNTFSTLLKTFIICNIDFILNFALISLYTSNFLIYVKISLLINIYISNSQTIQTFLLLTYISLSSLFKSQSQIICKCKLFLLIDTIINSITLHCHHILKKIIETIEETIKFGQQRKDALFIMKKIVGQANILRKKVKIQKISSKSVFLQGLISKQVNILQSIKKLIKR